MRFVPSLRLIGALYATIVTLIIVAASGYVLYDLYRQSQQQGVQRIEREFAQQAQGITQLVQFYSGVAERLARQRTVVDLALFADHTKAQEWSASLRAHLPDVTGLALFATDGGILGESAPQRVGQLCLADMRRLATGMAAPRFPVHSERAGLEHVDITATVKESENTAGILFLSLSLQRLQQTLEEAAVAGQALVLHDAEGKRIASIDKLGEASDAQTEQGPIPGTPWSLELTQRSPDVWRLYQVFIPATVVAALAAIVLILVLSWNSTRLFTRELDQLRAMLQQVAEGTPLGPQRQPWLRELQPIIPAIHVLAAQIQDKQNQLAELSATDALTKLANRRRFETDLASAFANAQRGHAMYLALIDLDYFKDINDQQGHDAGDRVLCALADVLRHECRAGDQVARLGGDEFAAILADTTSKGVEQWYERLREHLRSAAETASLTISVGFIALGGGRFDKTGDALRAADAALYQAKERGRNCVVEG